MLLERHDGPTRMNLSEEEEKIFTALEKYKPDHPGENESDLADKFFAEWTCENALDQPPQAKPSERLEPTWEMA